MNLHLKQTFSIQRSAIHADLSLDTLLRWVKKMWNKVLLKQLMTQNKEKTNQSNTLY